MSDELSAEVRTQLNFLDVQRAHVLGILEGLAEEDLRRPVLASGWGCLGLVKHLTYDVEHYWMRCVVAGESLEFFAEHGLDNGGSWRVRSDESAEAILRHYREAAARSNAILESVSFDAPPAQRDPWWGEWQVPDVRFVVAHVIAETATHAGHLDAVRELLDGRQWLVL